MKKLLSTFLSLLLTLVASGTVPPGYYSAANGLKKDKLKQALHNIIGSAKTLDYGSGSGKTWYGFYMVDRLENNQVCDRYSYDKRYFSSGSYSAVNGMNIEHSMAKSWWGGSKNQAYCDIHHLMPCETTINSKKSNYPMGLVSNDKNGNGCTKVGTGSAGSHGSINLWEPADEWKGDFARVYFYMSTCYSNLNWTSEGLNQLENNDWPTLQRWTYELLLQWNAKDPVSDLEKKRNEGVYSIQGNRNPFIDYPELAEYIWGSKTAEAWTEEGSEPDPPTPPTPPTPSTDLPSESFAESLGDFTAVTYYGEPSSVWSHNSDIKCAVGNAYSLGKVADAWLVSPEIDLTDYQTASFAFSHAAGYHGQNNPKDKFSVMVSYEPDKALNPSSADWEEVYVPSWPTTVSSGFSSFVESGIVNLDDHCGEKIRIAFRYESTSSACWAWEVRNFYMSGEKRPSGIDDNFAAPLDDEQAVFTIGGVYVGTELPQTKGIYVVRSGKHSYVITNR